MTAYFLIAYAVFNRAWRLRGQRIEFGAVRAMGAVAAAPTAVILLAPLNPMLAGLPISLGVTTFGWIRILLTGGKTAGLGPGLRRALRIAAAASLIVGFAFTLWLVWTVLWRDLDVSYFVAREGLIAYASVAAVSMVWFVASCGAVLGACSFSLFLAPMIRSLGRLVVRSGDD